MLINSLDIRNWIWPRSFNLFQPNVAFRIETSRPEVFCKKGILTNFANFTGKHKQILENKFCTILLSLNFKRNKSFQYLRNILNLKTIPFRDRLKISLILISKYK